MLATSAWASTNYAGYGFRMGISMSEAQALLKAKGVDTCKTTASTITCEYRADIQKREWVKAVTLQFSNNALTTLEVRVADSENLADLNSVYGKNNVDTALSANRRMVTWNRRGGGTMSAIYAGPASKTGRVDLLVFKS